MPTDDPIPDLKRQMDDELARVIDGWATHDIAAALRTDRAPTRDLKARKAEAT